MMDKITITSDEIAQGSVPLPPRPEKRLIPIWLRVLSSLLVLFPPVLYILTLAVLPSIRKRPLAIKHAWAVHFCCLLVASGVLWLVVALVISLTRPPPPNLGGKAGLTLSNFPSVPSTQALSAKDIAYRFRPLVFVVHGPKRHFPFIPRPLQGSRVGAAVVVHADTEGCVAVTSRHVVQPFIAQQAIGQILAIADENGKRAPALLIGTHRELDLALLWIKQENGTNGYTQPIRSFPSIDLGEIVFAIGHPEGLDFSISSGIISQKRGADLLQVTAAASPGSSGGPVYDEHGVLLGILDSVIDKAVNPNAENLNFAVRADALLESTGWNLDARGVKAISILRLEGQAVIQPEDMTSQKN